MFQSAGLVPTAPAAPLGFGRYGGQSGHGADTPNRSLLTLRVISRPSIIALRKAHSITSSARLSKGLRQRYTESLRSLEVEHQRDFHRLYYRQVFPASLPALLL